MKRIVLLAIAMMLATASIAQQLNLKQFATLTHNDTVSGQWYGPDAFVSAHEAALHGDIITLSPGNFNPPLNQTITKAVTIRGHGMFFDSIANTEPTKITGNIILNIPNIENKHLVIEGVNFSGDCLGYRLVYNPVFIKCKINSVRANIYYSIDGFIENPIFTDCIIGIWDGAGWYVTNAMFVNTVINNCWSGSHPFTFGEGFGNYGSYPCGTSHDVYYNCIINLSPSYTSNKRMIVNSIVYSNDTIQSTSTNVTNTIGITDSTNYFAAPSTGNNTNIQGFESIFKTFRGTYTEGETFELTPQAAATYLGADNTQVGIYGGSSPFNPKATDPRIMKVSPAYSSNGNGQLPVNVQLRAE